MKIIFHENQLSYRGTTNAVYNYALFNEELLGNESIILYNRSVKNNFSPAIEKFKKRFKVLSYTDKEEISKITSSEKADVFYAIKAGHNDGILSRDCKNVIHVVFKNFDPHGQVYAYVSKWLSNEMTNNEYPYVPHMICLENTKEDLRKELHIPQDAIVFGRHGGGDTFDINFAKRVVKAVSKKRKDIYFLFLGTDNFVFKTIFQPYTNIIFLPTTQDEIFKRKFINTCDAYLHARKQGESFGIAIGEFSFANKPVITWKNSKEKAHLDILKNKAIVYDSAKDLSDILLNFRPDKTTDWNMYENEFSPIPVMKKFDAVFLK